VSDLVAEFGLLLKQSAPEPGGSIDLVLGNLAPGEGTVLRRAALTHQFTREILRILDPELSEEEAAALFTRFNRLSAVMVTPDGLALHDRAREHLFRTWLRAPGGEFREIHARLAAFVAAQLENASDTTAFEKLSRRLIFHRVGVDQDDGIAAFEEEFERYRERLRFTACENLLRLVREYEPILSNVNRARVAYREAKLAFDRGENERALELFSATSRSTEINPILRTKAWYGVGLTHDAMRNWRKAIDALNRALQLAEATADAHYLQCRILRSLAAVFRDTGEIEKSEKLLNKAIDLARSADDDRGLAAAYNAFGTLYHRANDPEKAITNLNESLAHMPLEHFDRARVYNNLGLAYLRLRKFDESERWFKRSLELKALGGDTLGQANTQMNLVRLYREGASLAKATRAATAAAELFGRVFAWRETGDARATLAHLLAESGDRERAEAELSAAVEAYTRVRADGDIEAARNRVARALAGGRGKLPPWLRATLTGLLMLIALGLAASLHTCSTLLSFGK